MNKLREQLIADLERYKSYGTPFTEDMADHILKQIEAALPDNKPSEMFYQEGASREEIAYRKGYNSALADVRTIIGGFNRQ